MTGAESVRQCTIQKKIEYLMLKTTNDNHLYKANAKYNANKIKGKCKFSIYKIKKYAKM